MAGDRTYSNTPCGSTETFCPSSNGERDLARDTGAVVGNLKGRGGPMLPSPNFEVIGGLLYRKKLERGFINYREVLNEDRRHEAISTFHRRRPGTRHLSFEDTYKCVAENYWWDGMYFHIRSHVMGCPGCQGQHSKKTEGGGGSVSKTMTSHGGEVLSKLRSQREAGLFCDITLRTEGRSYSAHRAVLAAVSEYFQEIFAEMDLDIQADIDLTGFSEESLLSLLDFSYSSTLHVRWEDLPEVSAMARHLGMWPAVEACSALLREQQQPALRCPKTGHPGRKFPPAGPGSRRDLQADRKRKKMSAAEDSIEDGFSWSCNPPDESLAESPRRTLRADPRPRSRSLNILVHSPRHKKMKLMDFKSPSFKKVQASSGSTSAAAHPGSCTPSSPSHTRLLRSTPGAAQEVQRLLPRPESPRRNRKCHPAPRTPSTSRTQASAALSPVRIKQEAEEVGEDEEDSARAQEKYRFMNALGLQRTALLPRPEDLIGWRQKKRLRKLKANNYSLTKPRNPRPPGPALALGGLPLSLPLCNPVSAHFLNPVKAESADPVGTEKKVKSKKPRPNPSRVPPSDRSTRSKGAVQNLLQNPLPRSAFGGRVLRSSPRSAERAPVWRVPGSDPSNTPARSVFRIKAEPLDYAISGPHLPSNSRRDDAKPREPLSPGRSNAVAAGAVRALRYNGHRPASKTKLKRAPAKTRRRPGEEGSKAESERLSSSVDGSSLCGRLNKLDGLEMSENLTPPPIYSHPLYKVIKEEPADPLPVTGPFPDPPSPDLGKRRSKPPIKLLDPSFLFTLCRPPGVPVVGVKKEEESVDICLTRSVLREKFAAAAPQIRVLRPRGVFPALHQVKREREEKKVSHGRVQRPRSQPHRSNGSAPVSAKRVRLKAKLDVPEVDKRGKPLPLSSRRHALLESIHRSRLKRLRRRPRSQNPRPSHSCLECHTSYRDCVALVMHRLRHVEGKHWPCPLCSKTFFRLRNVRNHIRTHDQKLYKCRSCMVAAS